MDPFLARLLTGCLIIWLVVQFIAAFRAAFSALRRATTSADADALIWFIFVLLVCIWIFLAAYIPFLNFQPK